MTGDKTNPVPKSGAGQYSAAVSRDQKFGLITHNPETVLCSTETKLATAKGNEHFDLLRRRLETSKGSVRRPIDGRGAGGEAKGINSNSKNPTPSVTRAPMMQMLLYAMPMNMVMLPRRRKVRQGACSTND